MNRVTQDMLYRQSLVKYALKYSFIEAAIKYQTNRQYVYRWLKRYDGTLLSLAYRSRRSHSHPNQQPEAELRLIRSIRERNKHLGLVMLWIRLRQKGYTRPISSLFRMLRRLGLCCLKLVNPKGKGRTSQSFEPMSYLGHRVQVEVKHVLACCIADVAAGKRYYQYTAIDEFSRFRYVEAFDEANTTNSERFLMNMLRAFKFKVQCLQTDNGTEFTNRFTSSKGRLCLFEKALKFLKIEHRLIRPYTPQHNGKVERSHRKDNEYFYALRRFHFLDDFARQLRAYNRRYNNCPMRSLRWRAPREMLRAFLDPAVTDV